MKQFFLSKKFNLASMLAAVVLAAAITVPITLGASDRFSPAPAATATPAAADWEALYQKATVDAMTIEPDEVLPVLAIHPDEPLVRWNEEGKVLLVTMHSNPESYVAGAQATLEHGEVWVTSLAEMEAWYKHDYGDGKTEDNWTARFEMLLGMPADGTHRHFSALWADPADIVRPAYNPDATNSQMYTHFTGTAGETDEFLEWFDDNILWSYFESDYPWTRLGYTYDYSDNWTEYGLSEFLINADSTVDVEFTYTVDEMVAYLRGQADN